MEILQNNITNDFPIVWPEFLMVLMISQIKIIFSNNYSLDSIRRYYTKYFMTPKVKIVFKSGDLSGHAKGPFRLIQS